VVLNFRFDETADLLVWGGPDEFRPPIPFRFRAPARLPRLTARLAAGPLPC